MGQILDTLGQIKTRFQKNSILTTPMSELKTEGLIVLTVQNNLKQQLINTLIKTVHIQLKNKS